MSKITCASLMRFLRRSEPAPPEHVRLARQPMMDQSRQVLALVITGGADRRHRRLFRQRSKRWVGSHSLLETILNAVHALSQTLNEMLKAVHSLRRDKLGEELANDRTNGGRLRQVRFECSRRAYPLV